MIGLVELAEWLGPRGAELLFLQPYPIQGFEWDDVDGTWLIVGNNGQERLRCRHLRSAFREERYADIDGAFLRLGMQVSGNPVWVPA